MFTQNSHIIRFQGEYGVFQNLKPPGQVNWQYLRQTRLVDKKKVSFLAPNPKLKLIWLILTMGNSWFAKSSTINYGMKTIKKWTIQNVTFYVTLNSFDGCFWSISKWILLIFWYTCSNLQHHSISTNIIATWALIWT